MARDFPACATAKNTASERVVFFLLTVVFVANSAFLPSGPGFISSRATGASVPASSSSSKHKICRRRLSAN
eukprot:762604-Rhodomonas_salina.1